MRLWTRRQWVAPLGTQSDVFANLLVNSRPHWEEALLLAYPTAIIFGAESLRRAGWITQIPWRPKVAVVDALPLMESNHFMFEQRDDAWFERVKHGCVKPVELLQQGWTQMLPWYAPYLRPAWALADLLATYGWGQFGLDPDDFDVDEITDRDRCDWLCASQALGVAVGELLEMEALSRSCIR